jgi:hypothetical protein
VRPSFVPPRPQRELRDLVRYRKAKIQERTREVQRLDKVLQDAAIKPSSVASKVLGVSGRALREALEGRFTDHHALLVSQMLAQIDFLDETVAVVDLNHEWPISATTARSSDVHRAPAGPATVGPSAAASSVATANPPQSGGCTSRSTSNRRTPLPQRLRVFPRMERVRWNPRAARWIMNA